MLKLNDYSHLNLPILTFKNTTDIDVALKEQEELFLTSYGCFFG